jgi:hypothetical protein
MGEKMKFLKNASYLLFVTLFLTSCDSDDDSSSGSLVGEWDWESTTVTIGDSEETLVSSENDTWMITFNDNNTFTEVRCCYDDDDDGVNDDTEEGNGAWSTDSGVLTVIIYEDGNPDGTFNLDYVLSNESNTLTMTQIQENYNDEMDTAVVVYILNRVE